VLFCGNNQVPGSVLFCVVLFCGNNQDMSTVVFTPAQRTALDALTADLGRVFGPRLQSIVAYGPALGDGESALHTLVLVERLGFDDLAACAPLADRWQRSGLATPLVLPRQEFIRTLDVFPVEYGAIIDHHALVAGPDPFSGCAVCEADLRRAVELQAKSHLIHLREGFLEAGGRPERIWQLMKASVPAYRSLLQNLDRLNPAADERAETKHLLGELAAGGTIADPSAVFARYVADVERIWTYVDAWRA
jgi:hypothetical protein